MKKLQLIFCGIMFTYSCFQQSVIGNQNIITVPVNASGSLTKGLLYLPKNYEKSLKHYPLIIYLNGRGQGGTNIKDMLGDGLPKTIAKGLYPTALVNGKIYEFIVFSPQGPEWSYHDKEVKYILPYLENKYRIDTTRIYVTGISAGAGGAYSCVATTDSTLGNKIAAVVAVSPLALDYSQDEDLRKGIKKYATPVLSICGTYDIMMKDAIRYDTLINNLNPPVKYKLISIVHGEHTVSDTAYNPKSTFGDFGMSIYQWMLQYTRNTVKDSIVQTVSKKCRGKKIYIEKHPDNNVFIDGRSIDYNAGDTLVLKNSQNPYGLFELAYFTKGTDSCPVVIINEDGRVNLTRGFSFTSCRHLKITGTGTTDKYGFYISQKDIGGAAVSVQGRSSNIEIEHLEVYNKFYGVLIKHEADCDDSLQFPNWVLHDMSIHDNYIHHTFQEGMYLGSTDPNGFRTTTCNGKTISPKPMRLGNFRIYNNIVDSTGRDGIQLSSADSGYNEIYNNTVTNNGLELNTKEGQGMGILIGGYTHADIHDNYVRTTFGPGIFSLGAGTIRIYNNDVDSSGYLGGRGDRGSSNIMVDTRPTNNPSPGQSNPVLTRFFIWNNNLGLNTDYSIRVFKTNNTFLPGNIICNNTGNIMVAEGVNWSKNCDSLKNFSK